MRKKFTKSKNQLNLKRQRWFKLIAISFPFILLFLIELFLRVINYGNDLKLFKQYTSDQRFYVINDKIGNKYFTNKNDVTVAKHDIFLKEKPKGTFRIFILGASSSIGFPYKNATTFDLSIKYQLSHFFPNKNFEVVNLSLTAVNSFTLLDFAKDLPSYSPDMILIYAGHNEYYGALGVGSSSKIGSNRTIIKLLIQVKKLRIFQCFQNLLRANENKKNKTNHKQLMERMAEKKSILFQSKAFKKGIENYKKNMDDLCNIFNKINVPVLFSTIVSNEKDLFPFSSSNNSKEKSANFQFQLATKAYSVGDFKKAKEKYVIAKELDLLRFRAPSKINQIIKEISKKYSNVYLVDSKGELEKSVENKILGKELILEHVHPNLHGHRLISYAFVDQLMKNKLISLNWPLNKTINKVRKNIPYPEIDSIRGEFITLMMKEDWPFNEPIPQNYNFKKTYEHKAAFELCMDKQNWLKKTNEIKSYYYKNKNFEELKNILEKQAVMYSYDALMQINAGGINGELKNKDRAIYYFKKAYNLKPDSSSAHNLAIAYLKKDQPEKSYYYFNYMLKQLNLEIGKEGIKLLTPILKLKKELSENHKSTHILKKIADQYSSINLNENAEKYHYLAKKALSSK